MKKISISLWLVLITFGYIQAQNEINLEAKPFWTTENSEIVLPKEAAMQIIIFHELCLQRREYCEKNLAFADSLISILDDQIEIMTEVERQHDSLREHVRVTLVNLEVAEAYYIQQKIELDNQLLKEKIKKGKWKLRFLFATAIAVVEGVIIYYYNRDL